MPDPTIDDVTRELSEAEKHAADLEQAVIDGDTTVSPETIEKARSHIGFLRLKRQGAEKRQAAREEADREAAIAEAYAEREQFYTNGIAPAQKAYAALITATQTFRTEYRKLLEAHAGIGARAQEMGLQLNQDVTWALDFASYLDGDGDAFIGAAMRDAAGEPLTRDHGLHSSEIRAEYAERQAAQQRWEDERRIAYEAGYTTGPEYAA